MADTRFSVGDEVIVLEAILLPKRLVEKGRGRIHKITRETSRDPLYWVEGFPLGRTALVLRPATTTDPVISAQTWREKMTLKDADEKGGR